jgi:hypothetical protein
VRGSGAIMPATTVAALAIARAAAEVPHHNFTAQTTARRNAGARVSTTRKHRRARAAAVVWPKHDFPTIAVVRAAPAALS